MLSATKTDGYVFEDDSLKQKYDAYQKINSIKSAFTVAASTMVSVGAGVVFYQSDFRATVALTGLATIFTLYEAGKLLVPNEAPSYEGVCSDDSVSKQNKKVVERLYKEQELIKRLSVHQKQSLPTPVIARVASGAATGQLTLNTEMFDQLNKRAKSFVVGHELSHIINKDVEKEVLLNISMGVPIISMIGSNLYAGSPALVSLSLGVMGTQLLLKKKFSRQKEERADVHGVLTGGGVENAREFFKKKFEIPAQAQQSLSLDFLCGRQKNNFSFSNLLKTHPSREKSWSAITKAYG